MDQMNFKTEEEFLSGRRTRDSSWADVAAIGSLVFVYSILLGIGFTIGWLATNGLCKLFGR